MDIKTFLKKKKIDRTEFARKVGISPAYVSQIVGKAEYRKPSRFLCLEIERVTRGLVSAAELRPDLFKSNAKKKSVA